MTYNYYVLEILGHVFNLDHIHCLFQSVFMQQIESVYVTV